MARTDKECAQELVATAIVVGDDTTTFHQVVQENLSREEIVRGAVYIESGQKVSGPVR